MHLLPASSKLGHLPVQTVLTQYVSALRKTSLLNLKVEADSSVFVKRRQPAKIATYFAFCASYFNKLIHRLYYKAVNLARFMTMSAGYSKT